MAARERGGTGAWNQNQELDPPTPVRALPNESPTTRYVRVHGLLCLCLNPLYGLSVGTLPGTSFVFRFEYAKTRVKKGGEGWCPVLEASGGVVGWSWETYSELVVVDAHGAWP